MGENPGDTSGDDGSHGVQGSRSIVLYSAGSLVAMDCAHALNVCANPGHIRDGGS